MNSEILDTIALGIKTVDACENFFSQVPKRSDSFKIKCALSKGILNVRLKSIEKYIKEFKEKNFDNTFQVIIILTYTLEDSYNGEGSNEQLEDLDSLREILKDLRYLVLLSDNEVLLIAESKIEQIRKKYNLD